MKLANQTDNEMVFEQKGSMFRFIFGLFSSTTSLMSFFSVIYNTLFAITTRQDFPWEKILQSILGLLMMLLGSVFGVLIMYLSLSETWIFNKSSYLFTHKRTNLNLMGTKTVSTESFANIQELQIIEGKDSDGDTYYDLKLLLKSANKYEIFSSSSLPEVEKFAKNLSNFLQISVNKIISEKNSRTY